MIQIRLVCIGNLKEKFWKDGVMEYAKRLSKFCKLNILELPEQNKYEDIEKIKDMEGREILNNLQGKTYLLDLQGQNLSSEEFAKEIEKSSLNSSTITFVIGGSYGVSKEVKDQIKNKISFGKMTLPHNLARLVLVEQIYRAFMISSGSTYHK